MFRLSSFGAKLARSLGSGCSGNTKQALKKHFQHKGMCLRPATFGFCTRKHTQVQKPVMPGVGFQGVVQLQGTFLLLWVLTKSM
jgi:hypothetical protein